MIKMVITRRPAKHFMSYAMIVSIDGKEYDLKVDFLIWANVKPNKEIEFFLRPETQPATLKGPRCPVTKRKAVEGFFRGHYKFIWKVEIEKVKDVINRISFPLNPKDNIELFNYCFNEPVSFSQAYDARLEDLKTYSMKNDQEIWSAPKWDEVSKDSLIPLNKVPKEADQFFLNIFQCAIKK